MPKSPQSTYLYNIEKFTPTLIKGWCVKINEPANIFKIGIFINEKKITEISNDHNRKDLLNQNLSAGKGGFQIENIYKGLSPGPYSLKIQFPDGTFSSSYEFEVRSSEYRYNIEAIFPIFQAWCVNTTYPHEMPHVIIHIDNAAFCSTFADVPRPDLVKIKLGNGKGGIKLPSLFKHLQPGTHSVRLEFPDGKFSPPTEFEIQRPEYAGRVEKIAPHFIGWCFNKSKRDDIFYVDLFLNDKWIASVKNDFFRDDLRARKLTPGTGGLHIVNLYLPPSDSCELKLRFPDGKFSEISQFSLLSSQYEGKITSIRPFLTGECRNLARANARFDIDIYIDNSFYSKCKNIQLKKDVLSFKTLSPFDAISYGNHCFRIKFPDGLFSPEFKYENLPYIFEGSFSSILPYISGRITKNPSEDLVLELLIDGSPYESAIVSPDLDFNFSCPLFELQQRPHIFSIRANGYIINEFMLLPPRGESQGRSWSNNKDPIAVYILASGKAPVSEKFLIELFKNTPQADEFIFISDESDLILSLSQEFQCKTRIIPPAANTLSENINMALLDAGENDVVILTPDCLPTTHWLRAFSLCIHSRSMNGLALPMFYLPYEQNDERELPLKDRRYPAESLSRSCLEIAPEVTGGWAGCFYLKANAISEINFLSKDVPENEILTNICSDLSRKGWRSAIAPNCVIFVNDKIHNTLSDIEKDAPAVKAEIRSDLRMLRQYARTRALAAHCRLNTPGLLFVTSTTTGGTPQTNIDLMGNFQDSARCFLLRCDASTLYFYSYEDGDLTLIEERPIGDKIDPFSHISSEYDFIVAEFISKYNIDLVHIRHLLWHSLNIIPIAKSLGCKVIFSLHDYYAISSNHNLVDDSGVFRGKDFTNNSTPWRSSIWRDKDIHKLPFDNPGFEDFWKKRFGYYLKQCDALITTSPYARDLALSELSDLKKDRFFIIPHGRDFKSFQSISQNTQPGQPINILVPGNINYQKGLGILESLIEYDRLNLNVFKFHVLGACKAHNPGIVNYGTYEREKFAIKAAQTNPVAAAIFSVWDETWCHTLTEVWSVGLPAFVFDIGILAHRVRESGGGWVLPLEDIPDLYWSMVKKLNDGKEMANARYAVARWQNETARINNTRFMWSGYYAIYRRLLGGASESYLVAVHKKDDAERDPLQNLCVNDFSSPITWISLNTVELKAFLKKGILDGVIVSDTDIKSDLLTDLYSEVIESKLPLAIYVTETKKNIKQEEKKPDAQKWDPGEELLSQIVCTITHDSKIIPELKPYKDRAVTFSKTHKEQSDPGLASLFIPVIQANRI